RRRHTRFSRDWSSDVCSSDLEGNSSITKSSIVCTPLFLNDEPHTIGTNALSNTALRKASKISRSVNESGSSKNFSIKDSSYPATASNNFSRYSATSSAISSGIGTSVKVIPLSSLFHTIPRLLIKSTTPSKSSSAPIGNCNATASEPNISFTCLTTFKKSAPERSILFTKPIRGTLYPSAKRQFVSDCGSTPSTAENKNTNPSNTRKERFTSTVKSTWPGV